MSFKEKYFNLWGEAWSFHKKYSDVNGTDKYWKQVIDESGDIMKEYEGKPEYNFMKNLIMAVALELERIDKVRQREGHGNEKK